MKKIAMLILMAMFVIGLTAVSVAASENEVDAAMETSETGETVTTKNGLVMEGGKYYYYEDGEKLTNTLKTITVDGVKYRYYFGSNGAAYTNKWKTITKNGKNYRYYFGADGIAYSGTTAEDGTEQPALKKIDGVTYAFNSKGYVYTGLAEKNGKYYYFKSGEKLTNTLKAITVDGVKCRYYFGKTGAAYTSRWKAITVNGKKYYYYFGKDGVAYAGTSESPVVKTINGVKYAFGSNGRALTGVQVIKDKFYVFTSRGKLNSTKTTKLRKASKYEKNFATLKKLLKSYGAKLKKTTYYGSSCYGNGEDGEVVYSGFTVYVFKYATSGKVIVFGVERN